MTIRAAVSPNAAATEITLNTGVIQTITSDTFGLRLDKIDSNLFYPNEIFTWFSVVNASNDLVVLTFELSLNNKIINKNVEVRIGAFYPIRAVSVTSNDTSAIINVGIGQ
jgi:hypothetical protein